MMENEKKTKYTNIYSWIDVVVCAVLSCVLIFLFLFKVYRVIGDSMVPQLHDGDRVFTVVPYFGVQQGDVVVTDSYNGVGDPLIKRVIATGGQTVVIDSATGAIYVDGVLFQDKVGVTTDTVRGNQVYPLLVPEGSVFLVGDNRIVSLDSRFTDVGCIPVEDVVAKVVEVPFG